MSDLEQGSSAQDLVLCEFCNKGVIEMSSMEDVFLYKKLEDLCTGLKELLKNKTNQLQPAGRRSVKEKNTNRRGRKKMDLPRGYKGVWRPRRGRKGCRKV